MNSPSGRSHHFLDFLSSCFGAAEFSFSLFWVSGMQPHPQEFCFLSAIRITSFPFVSVSLAFAFLDTFLDSGQFLLQLVPIVLQAFPFLLSGEEPAESRTAATPATPTGGSGPSTGYLSRVRLTHRNHLLSAWCFRSFHRLQELQSPRVETLRYCHAHRPLGRFCPWRPAGRGPLPPSR